MMNVVRNRDEFIDYCFRQLGEPVIQVNVDQEQAEDRINDALQMFIQYHFDASYREVITIKVTEENIKNQLYLKLVLPLAFYRPLFGKLKK
jgi:hypothetical protein